MRQNMKKQIYIYLCDEKYILNQQQQNYSFVSLKYNV